jgi:hypothetical protein
MQSVSSAVRMADGGWRMADGGWRQTQSLENMRDADFSRTYFDNMTRHRNGYTVKIEIRSIFDKFGG